jgi:hypothetical protein
VPWAAAEGRARAPPRVWLVVAGQQLALLVAASIADGYIGLIAALASDVFGAMRRHD